MKTTEEIYHLLLKCINQNSFQPIAEMAWQLLGSSENFQEAHGQINRLFTVQNGTNNDDGEGSQHCDENAVPVNQISIWFAASFGAEEWLLANQDCLLNALDTRSLKEPDTVTLYEKANPDIGANRYIANLYNGLYVFSMVSRLDTVQETLLKLKRFPILNLADMDYSSVCELNLRTPNLLSKALFFSQPSRLPQLHPKMPGTFCSTENFSMMLHSLNLNSTDRDNQWAFLSLSLIQLPLVMQKSLYETAKQKIEYQRKASRKWSQERRERVLAVFEVESVFKNLTLILNHLIDNDLVHKDSVNEYFPWLVFPPEIRCLILTHLLRIATPMGFWSLETVAFFLHWHIKMDSEQKRQLNLERTAWLATRSYRLGVHGVMADVPKQRFFEFYDLVLEKLQNLNIGYLSKESRDVLCDEIKSVSKDALSGEIDEAVSSVRNFYDQQVSHVHLTHTLSAN